MSKKRRNRKTDEIPRLRMSLSGKDEQGRAWKVSREEVIEGESDPPTEEEINTKWIDMLCNLLWNTGEQEQVDELSECPDCGGQIRLLSSEEGFCLDCNWDNIERGIC